MLAAASLAVSVALTAPPAAALDLAARVQALAPGHWLELTGNAAGTIEGTRLERVAPPRAGHPAWGNQGPRALMRAWSGAAYDPDRRWLLVFGGGHRDYGGNEVYAFDLNTLEWKRLTEPSRYGGDPKAPDTLDGTPVSRHTYDGLEYLPRLGRLFLFGGSNWGDVPGWGKAAWLFDPAARRWQRRAEVPGRLWGPPAAAVEPRSGHVLIRFPKRFLEYDPAADHWLVRIANDSWWGEGTAAIDPVSNRFIEVTKGRTWYLGLDATQARSNWCRRPTPGCWSVAPTSGDREVEELKPGLAYDPVRRRLIAWDGGRAVWSLDPASWRWTRHDNAGGPAPEKFAGGNDIKTRGVYGRWRYVPSLDAFIGVNAISDNVWIYKMPRLGEPAGEGGAQ